MAKLLQTLFPTTLMFLLAVVSGPAPGRASTVALESAQLGAVGQIGGSSITHAQYVGWRFTNHTALDVTHIGGHLLGTGGDVFGAIVSLPAIDAFPYGDPFAPNEVVASVTFSAPFPSEEILVPMSATLAPGDYALIYGSGQFGTTGGAALPNHDDQPDIPPTSIESYIFWGKPNAVDPPIWRNNLNSHMRFVVQGEVPFTLGDVNGDDVVNGLDIDPFLGVLVNGPYQAEADMNQDAAVNGLDVEPFAAAVAGPGGARTIPEPPSVLIAVIALVGSSIFRRCGSRQPIRKLERTPT